MIFLFMSLCAAIVALHPSKKKSFFFLIIICATFPTSHAYSQIISYQGVYFYDAFMVFYLVRVLFESLLLRSFVFNARSTVVCLLLINLFFVVMVLPFVELDKYYLKDLRPILNIFFFICAYDLCLKAKVSIDKLLFRRLALIAATAAFVKFLILYFGLYAYQDVYYQDNAYRYIDSSAYFCAVYLIVTVVDNFKWSFSAVCRLALPAGALLLANSRFVLLSLVLSVLVGSVKNIKNFIGALCFVCLVAGGFLYLSVELEISRVADANTLSGVFDQLRVRFSPAVAKVIEFSVFNYFFGMGAGTFFEIPWFAYRGLELNHSNIDSAYLTYFVKYGFFGFIFLYGYAIALVPPSRNAFYVRFFLASMFFVEAVQYQPFSIGLMASMVLLNHTKSVRDKNANC